MNYQSYAVWAANIVYSLGECVTGSDGRVFRSLSHHKSSADSEPVSGTDTATYWASAPYQTLTWATTTKYVIGMMVTGSDGKAWTCKVRHTSASTNRPSSGISYATYWSLSKPGVARARKPDGGIAMQEMVTDDNKRHSPPSYSAVMKKFPYKL